MIIDCFPDRLISQNNETFLYFGGTSYLGMATLPAFQEQLFNSIKQWGTSYGSSRNANVKLAVYDEFETLFSKFIGAESALTVSSGMLAGRLVVEYFKKNKCSFFHYPNSHPAILDSSSQSVFENRFLHPDLTNAIKEDVIIVLDAVLSSEVYPTSFSFLEHISEAKQITLIIDESHSLGIVGPSGEGVFNTVEYKNIHRKIMVSSLGKALGLSGGIIVSDTDFIEILKQENLFISSSAANPAYLDAFLKSKELYSQQMQKLKDNLKFFFSELQLSSKFKYDVNYPVIYCNDESVYKLLYDNGILIANFKYPNYEGLMSRIVITANHTREDLLRLKQVLKRVT
ncbi:aminotransferase class I/II-fold pyridoxal phosphate-dependent enzyme [Aestuariibaculum lutulentum]|uniref:Aminotransferase class I/II-fold pyridoxal phosphate-dependent enzyme n=1 Tax=Aestuariibaculum lutulentum TaxID=2920935 RepID=A0ABS9RH61_9FLAO|nr:aminotransferase class I/II-fold pyridoxal phosphate-dependent enzyme [Aestuariibaculum lutulentum]MCH4552247.1 aminotransferase class I/II-fold pyridoxal phosphate-dependent enzyme [Aestuariibaculum lutulentum]